MFPKKTKINFLKFFTIICGILIFLSLGDFSFANPSLPPKPDTLPGPETLLNGSNSDQRSTILDYILPNFTVLLIGFIGAAALVFLIIGGLRMVVSFGEDDSVTNGKNQVKWGIIGLIVSLLSYTVVRIIVNLEFENDQSRNETGPEGPTPNIELIDEPSGPNIELIDE